VARKGWDELTPEYRKRLAKSGITKAAYEAGASLKHARGYHPREISREERTLAEAQFEELAGPEDIPFSYDPTKTTWPDNGWKHRRTTRAGYDSQSATLVVEFYTNGAVYQYRNVSLAEAQAFRRAPSPGQYINAILNAKPYERIR
jgi:hypothetical protein